MINEYVIDVDICVTDDDTGSEDNDVDNIDEFVMEVALIKFNEVVEVLMLDVSDDCGSVIGADEDEAIKGGVDEVDLVDENDVDNDTGRVVDSIEITVEVAVLRLSEGSEEVILEVLDDCGFIVSDGEVDKVIGYVNVDAVDGTAVDEDVSIVENSFDLIVDAPVVLLNEID